MTDDLILALDFGGTKHAAAVYQKGDNSWLRHRQKIAPSGSNAATDLEMMYGLATEILAGASPSAVGVSFGGPVHFETGLVRLSHHVAGWEDTPLKQRLEQRYGAPVVVENDANAGALGEYSLGAGEGCNSMLYITISSGVGGGWIINDQIWRGSQSMAGEIGHLTLNPKGPACLCGKRGCLERYASGPYMVQDVTRILKGHQKKGSILRDLSEGNPDKITARMIAEASALGDEVASARLQEAAWAVGTAIGNAANLMNPDRFILGGGVTGAGDNFWEIIRREAVRVALPETQFEVSPAALQGQSPLWGAAILAQQMFP